MQIERLMIRLSIAVLFSLVSKLSFAQQSSSHPRVCDDAKGAVKVTVVQSGTTYILSITNLGGGKIWSLSLGQVDSHAWTYTKSRSEIPKSVKAPSGWNGAVSFGDFNNELSAYWSTPRKGKHVIAPKSTLDGFVIEMPAPYDKLKELTFEAQLGKGKCVWGKLMEISK